MGRADDSGSDVNLAGTGSGQSRRFGEIDPTKPSAARIYDYYLGGKDNLAIDREIGDQMLAAFPDLRELVQVNRRFLVNAVTIMAESGIEQFVDLGTGIPTSPNVHEVARETHPDARVVYVDNDPVVIAHNRALRARTRGVIAVGHDLREPAAVLDDSQVCEVIDFDRPVGVLFVAVLHFIEHELSREIVAEFRRAMVPGSMMALSLMCTEGMEPEDVHRVESLYDRSSSPVVFRDRRQVEELFEGFDLVEPGLVNGVAWRAQGKPGSIGGLVGLGRRR